VADSTCEAAVRKLADDLVALGIRRGGVLLVHASLRSLGPLAGGAETVVRGVMCALGPDGTLLIPALSYENVGAHNRVFDVQHTPSCIGALPEYFRLRSGVIRSVHPTHSVCGIGPAADWLLGDHQLDATPCGPHSPLHKLPDAGGQVLFLGCGMRPNTSMHAIEELAQPPYLFSGEEITYQIILPSRAEMTMRVRAHDFAGWAQRYERLGSLLETRGMRCRSALGAAAHLVEGAAMWEAALEALRRDPLYFVERL
jgi:aminoglycoside 3-N-acetyltransferase